MPSFADLNGDPAILSHQLPHYSTVREKVLEHLLLGQLGLELLVRGLDFTVLHAVPDRDGYDLVIDAGSIARHIQLKSSVVGGKTRRVPINTRLAAKTSGCVVWTIYNPAIRDFSDLRWFGGAPNEPLPDLGDRPVRHSRGNSEGAKAIRPGMRMLTLARFERLEGIAALADRLFGPVLQAEAA